MTAPSLKKDTDIEFPHFTVLKASAGSGKTHTLTERFVQFILSEKIPRNRLRNILAVTFSNNAAKEMKERILLWLKSVYFDNPEQADELSQVTSLDREKMIGKAGMLIDEILDNYSDFQVRTIDSFMATIFKASAIDFGYNPEFEILMSNDMLMEYSFNLFLRNVREGTYEASLFEEIIAIIHEHKKRDSSYLWDPSKTILNEIKNIYRRLASTGKRPVVYDLSAEMAGVKDRIRETLDAIEDVIVGSGIERRGNSSYPDILSMVRAGSFADLIGKGMKNPPVNKPKTGNADALESYNRILDIWTEAGALINQYISLYGRSCYMPYLKVYERFSRVIEETKKHQGKIFIEDINRNLAEYINSEIVPDIYFRIGETIYHYLIDEFQDTSQVQWRNLFPLIENSLSQGGSSFVVGDTKQAIYGFRDADYTIMKNLEAESPFLSVRHNDVQELDINYRSQQRILEFNETLFKRIVAGSEEYRETGEQSGLIDYVQNVKEGGKGCGYAEVTLCERNDEDPSERQKIQELIKELRGRGYRYGDIAILTQKNEAVVKATAWLNEQDIPFISYSSLDIRRRKITGEIVSLLNFLDSPLDNLSFMTFLLGEIFARTIDRHCLKINAEMLREFFFACRDKPPLYKAFQKEFVDVWDRFFAGIFRSAGYLPLYDLVTEIFNLFAVFEILEDEEAALVKILEVVKDFEGAGYNNLRDFIDFASDKDGGESEWNIDVPKDMDAVKVMTIHKAKGLGFPAVIVLLYEERNRGFAYIVEEGKDSVCLLRVTKDISKSNSAFETLYAREELKEKVNRLNALYVGFTRAMEELYVIGVKGKNKGFPFDLLPLDEHPPSDKPVRAFTAGVEPTPDIPILHACRHIKFHAGPDEIMNIEERRRGEFIHRVLSFVEYIDDGFESELNRIIARVKKETGAGYRDDEMREAIAGLLGNKDIEEYFTQRRGREIKREQEYSDRDGHLFRMDRVIIDENRIAVMDFKTGRDRSAEAKHTAQLRTYLKILSEIYPDRADIEGIIAYVDLRETRRID